MQNKRRVNFYFLQIVRGLDYLYKYDIIYRDLKSDNILVISLDLEVLVNVKLFDYGIFKFNIFGGIVGLVGIFGYQVSEIMEGLVYDEKVSQYCYYLGNFFQRVEIGIEC